MPSTARIDFLFSYAVVAFEHDHEMRSFIGSLQGHARIGTQAESRACARAGDAALAHGRVLAEAYQFSGLLSVGDVGQVEYLDAAVEEALHVGAGELQDADQGDHAQVGRGAPQGDGLGGGLRAVLQIDPDDVVADLRHQLDVGDRGVPARESVENVVLTEQFAESVLHVTGLPVWDGAPAQELRAARILNAADSTSATFWAMVAGLSRAAWSWYPALSSIDPSLPPLNRSSVQRNGSGTAAGSR